MVRRTAPCDATFELKRLTLRRIRRDRSRARQTIAVRQHEERQTYNSAHSASVCAHIRPRAAPPFSDEASAIRSLRADTPPGGSAQWASPSPAAGLVHASSRLCACRFVKETIEGSHLEPSVICAMRYSLAMVLVLPALIAPGVRNISWNLSLELGFALFCAYQSQSQQLMTETASQGSIMLAVFILLVPVVELAFGRAFTRKKLVSLLVALFGISLLSIGGSPRPRPRCGSNAFDLSACEPTTTPLGRARALPDPPPPPAVRAGSSAEAPEVAVKTIMGIPEGSLWGLGSAIAFAVHLVRSEMRQHEAANVGQLAAGQLAVCGMLSLGLLGVQAATDPHIAQELDVGKIASVRPPILPPGSEL